MKARKLLIIVPLVVMVILAGTVEARRSGASRGKGVRAPRAGRSTERVSQSDRKTNRPVGRSTERVGPVARDASPRVGRSTERVRPVARNVRWPAERTRRSDRSDNRRVRRSAENVSQTVRQVSRPARNVSRAARSVGRAARNVGRAARSVGRAARNVSRPVRHIKRPVLAATQYRTGGITRHVKIGGHKRHRSKFRFDWGRRHRRYSGCIRLWGVVPTIIIESTVRRAPTTVVVEAPRVYVSTQDRLMDTVLRAKDRDRRDAARELARFDNIQSVAVLVDVLINDADGEVRLAAAESLAEIADAAAYEPLLRAADAEPDSQLRKDLVKALRTIEDSVDEDDLYVSPVMPPMNQGKEKLGQYLEDLRFGSAGTRKKAAKKLDDYRGTQAAAALINAFVNDRSDDVREEAAESLGKIGDRMALPFLRTNRYNDPDSSVRKKAAKAIERIYNTIQ